MDFAYAVHTEVGHRCIGAKVDGKLVALEKPLTNGVTVEIFTAKDASAGPSRDWQNFVVTGRAKTAIRQWFAKERRSEALERGKEQIAREIRRSGAPIHRLFSNDSLTAVARELSYSDVTALYTAVGEGHVSATHVLSKLIADFGGSEEVSEELAERSSNKKVPKANLSERTTASGVLVDGLDDVVVKLARCCTPVPGDEILGFVTRTGTVSVHRTDCTNAAELKREAERLVKVEWSGAKPDGLYLVAVQVEALDRQRLLSDITKAIADENVNILSATLQMKDDNRVSISRYSFEMANPGHLGQVLSSVRRVEGVYDAYRITNSSN